MVEGEERIMSEQSDVLGAMTDVPTGQEGKRIVGATAIIMLMHFLSKLLGFVQKAAVAAFFGTTGRADAIEVMERIFYTIYYIPEELLTHSFLPVFTRLRNQQGEKEAWRLAGFTLTLQALLLIAVVVLVLVGAPALVALFARGFREEEFRLSVELVRVAFWGLLGASLGSLTYVLLNCYKRFGVPAFGDVMWKGGIIVAALALCGRIGAVGYAMGFILGSLLKLATHLWGLRAKLSLLRLGWNLHYRPLRELGLLMVPLLAGSLVAKVRDMLETQVASYGPEGTLATLGFAKKVVLTPVQIFPYALGIALFPFLAEWAVRQDRTRFTTAFLGAVRMMLFVFLPLTVLFVVLGEPIVEFIYQRRAFTAADVQATLGPFLGYSLGMVVLGIEIICLQIFYSFADTKTPFWVGLLTSSLHVFLSWVGCLAMGWGALGIALSHTLSRTVKVGVLFALMKRQGRIEGFRPEETLPFLGKVLLATLLFGLTLAGGRHFVDPLFEDHIEATLHWSGSLRWALKGLYLGGLSLLAAGPFLLLCWAMGVEELRMVAAVVRRRWQRLWGKAAG